MDIEYDEEGWTLVHRCVAAEKELVMSIEKYVASNEEYLEKETNDEYQQTPLLLAVEKNKLKSVEKLISLGARITATNSYNHGIVEICALTENLEMLHHFIEKDYSELLLWKRLVKFMSASTDKEAEKAAMILERLTKENSNENKCDSSHWKTFVENDGIPMVVKVCKSSCGDHVKVWNIAVLNNIIHHPTVPSKFSKAGGIKVLVGLLGKGLKGAYTTGFNIVREIASISDEIASQTNDTGFTQIVVKLLNKPDKISTEALTNAILAIRNVAMQSQKLQKAVSETEGIFDAFHNLFDNPDFQTSVMLLDAMSRAIASIVKNSTEIQNLCINTGIACPLLMVSRASKYKGLQTSAVTALFHLSRNNKYTRKKILDEGAVTVLMQILRKIRTLPLQEAISLTLWSLAGADLNEKRSMASMMGVNMLIEFLGASGDCADNLNYVGAEGLGVLAQGAHNKQVEIAEANGIQPLIRQLRSSNTMVVISVIQTLRHLTVGIGFVPNQKNQTIVAQSRGLKFLVALMAHSKNELVQVESAITLGAITLGHQENTNSLHDNPDFSFLHTIRLLYSANNEVRCLAGSALAVFSFNNVLQQKRIADWGGVRWDNFSSFLDSKEDHTAISAAFQVVVLSRIIPDKEPALSSAEGIKTLIERLETTKDEEAKGYAADCIARLAHTRAGVPSAMVAINAVSLLCHLLNQSNDQVRGAAAVALGYLSFDHTAERELLRICRDNPHLIYALKYYTRNYKLSPAFLEGWKHCVLVGLPHPPSKEDTSNFKQSLGQRISNLFMKKPKELSTAFQSLTEDLIPGRAHSNHQISRSSQVLASLRDDMSQMHGQSSRSSRFTSQFALRNQRRNATSNQVSIPAEPSVSQQSQLSSVAVVES